MDSHNARYIYIHQGDDSDWNGDQFLTVNVSSASTEVDLSTMSAVFTLGSFSQTYSLENGSFVVNLASAVTGQYLYGPICGSIKILDSQNRIRTVANKIPFYITDDIITLQNQDLVIDVPGDVPGVTIDVTVGGTVNYNNLSDKPSINGVTIEGEHNADYYNLAKKTDLDTHIEDVNNPHEVTKEQVGLGNVDNTSDLNKPISTAVQNALNTKQDVIRDLATIRNGATLGTTAVQPATMQAALATKQDNLSASQLAAVNSGITSTGVAQIANNAAEINSIESKIPSQASASNQLADKGFVNSTVQTSTAHFRGNWETYAAIPTDGSLYPADEFGVHEPGPNDYLVVQADETQDGGTWRYKYTGNWATNGKNGWKVEYEVNETPLTAAQLAALNSGITSNLVTQISTNANNITSLQNGKQDVISDLSSIRSGASAGATALQPGDVTSTYSPTGNSPVNGAAVASAISTKLDITAAASTYVPLTQKAAANGVATLDANTLIPMAQLPTIDGGNANA